jgi:hypothetical protein
MTVIDSEPDSEARHAKHPHALSFFFGMSRLQERNQAAKCHPSKGPTRERCNLTDTTPRGAAQPSPRRMAMWATPSSLPAESRIQGPAYAPVK